MCDVFCKGIIFKSLVFKGFTRVLRVTCGCYLDIYVVRTVDRVSEVFFRHGCNGGLCLGLLRKRGVRGMEFWRGCGVFGGLKCMKNRENHKK